MIYASCFACDWEGEVDLAGLSLDVIDCPSCHKPGLVASRPGPSIEEKAQFDAIDQRMAGHDIMPFGQHEGKQLREVPLDYLDWVMGLDLRDPLKSSLQKYMGDPAIKRELEQLLVGRRQ